MTISSQGYRRSWPTCSLLSLPPPPTSGAPIWGSGSPELIDSISILYELVQTEVNNDFIEDHCIIQIRQFPSNVFADLSEQARLQIGQDVVPEMLYLMQLDVPLKASNLLKEVQGSGSMRRICTFIRSASRRLRGSRGTPFDDRMKVIQEVAKVSNLELVSEIHPVLASIISINVHLCTFCGDDTRQVKLEGEDVGANFVTPDGHSVCRNCLPDANTKYVRIMQRYF